jgi:hypothetical protein
VLPHGGADIGIGYVRAGDRLELIHQNIVIEISLARLVVFHPLRTCKE